MVSGSCLPVLLPPRASALTVAAAAARRARAFLGGGGVCSVGAWACAGWCRRRRGQDHRSGRPPRRVPNGVCKIAAATPPTQPLLAVAVACAGGGGHGKKKNEGGPRSSRGQRDASATWPSDGVCTPAHFLFCCTYSTYLQSCCVRLVRGPVRLDHDRFPHASDSSVCSGFCDGRALQCVIGYMHDHAVPGPADSKTEQKKRSAEAHGKRRGLRRHTGPGPRRVYSRRGTREPPPPAGETTRARHPPYAPHVPSSPPGSTALPLPLPSPRGKSQIEG